MEGNCTKRVLTNENREPGTIKNQDMRRISSTKPSWKIDGAVLCGGIHPSTVIQLVNRSCKINRWLQQEESRALLITGPGNLTMCTYKTHARDFRCRNFIVNMRSWEAWYVFRYPS